MASSTHTLDGKPFTPEASKVKRNKTTKEEREDSDSALKRIPKGVGRPRRFTPTKLRNRINDYFAWCEKKQNCPTVKGLTLHIGIWKDQWYQYAKYPDMKPIIDWAYDAMEAWSMNDLWHTASSNTNKQLVAKVNYGWQEEKTIHHDHMDKSQAIAKLEALAPMLLEVLKNQLAVNQLALPEQVIEGEVENG